LRKPSNRPTPKQKPTVQVQTSVEKVEAPAADGAPRVVLKPNEDRRLRRGHAWVFSNEVAAFPPALAAGDAVHFYTSHKEFLGAGYYNPHSLIAGRLFDRHATALDAAFFEKRLRLAQSQRDAFYGDKAYRWMFGESDDVPGLVIDRYNDVCVLESFAAGMDKLMPAVLEALRALGPWKALVLRNDVAARALENLPQGVEVVDGKIEGPHVFQTDGLKIAADLLQGHKTGFFFDQRDNRAALGALCAGKKVLDVFCHTGGFGLWAAKGGAVSVKGVDSSEPALELARQNAALNGFGGMTFEKADAFDFLTASKENFDVVVLDPPRFAPAKKQLPKAIEAYIRLNALGLKRVTGGGLLATASCSQHLDREEFRRVLSRAAQEAGRRARLIHWGGQAKDHPVRLSMPETEYLKFALLHVS